MRAIIVLAVILLLMGLVGWLTFGNSPGRATINIETEEIQRDTKNAIENTERMIESGARAITGEEEVPQQPVPAESEPVTTAPTETPVTSPAVAP
ncbi:MAG: hypothetical protein SH868_05325 [Bythopirellula sp.]|nr:hypothetical protein [Bythopirellula sp.]